MWNLILWVWKKYSEMRVASFYIFNISFYVFYCIWNTFNHFGFLIIGHFWGCMLKKTKRQVNNCKLWVSFKCLLQQCAFLSFHCIVLDNCRAIFNYKVSIRQVSSIGWYISHQGKKQKDVYNWINFCPCSCWFWLLVTGLYSQGEGLVLLIPDSKSWTENPS